MIPTGQMNPTIRMEDCRYDKSTKTLTLASEPYGMPPKIRVRSHFTGRIVEFIPAPIGHRFFDEDGFDGEMVIYIPVVELPNVEKLVIYNEY